MTDNTRVFFGQRNTYTLLIVSNIYNPKKIKVESLISLLASIDKHPASCTNTFIIVSFHTFGKSHQKKEKKKNNLRKMKLK